MRNVNKYEECKQVEVPNMILQPLIENAIKHAVYETLDKVTLTLTCTQENEFLKINLTNNYDLETETKNGSGIGLKNCTEWITFCRLKKQMILLVLVCIFL